MSSVYVRVFQGENMFLLAIAHSISLLETNIYHMINVRYFVRFYCFEFCLLTIIDLVVSHLPRYMSHSPTCTFPIEFFYSTTTSYLLITAAQYSSVVCRYIYYMQAQSTVFSSCVLLHVHIKGDRSHRAY